MHLEIQQIANRLSREQLIAYVNRGRGTQSEFMAFAKVSRQAVHKWATTPGRADTMTERARAWWVREKLKEIEGICEG